MAICFYGYSQVIGENRAAMVFAGAWRLCNLHWPNKTALSSTFGADFLPSPKGSFAALHLALTWLWPTVPWVDSDVQTNPKLL